MEIAHINGSEKKRENQRRTGSIILIGLLLLSTLGFALGTVADKNSQNLTSERFNGQYWVYTMAGREYYFSISKSEMDFTKINFTMNLADIQNKILYIDNPSGLSSAIIETDLVGWVGKIQPACFGKCVIDIPEKDCTEPIMVIRESESKTVRQQEQCVFIDGDEKTISLFLYQLLGMK